MHPSARAGQRVLSRWLGRVGELRIVSVRALSLRWLAAALVAFSTLGARPSLGDEPQAAPKRAPLLAKSRQLLLVRSASWVATTAQLQRYERSAESAKWHAVGDALQVNLGRNGMAWGRGLQETEPGPLKREGDGRTPAGVFSVGSLFGYAAKAPEKASPNFSYIHIGVGTRCVEDSRSPLYNQVVDMGSASPMLRADGVFRLGFVIEQNAPDTAPGAGSCVFFHVQRGPAQVTHGCTSTSLPELERIVAWLEPKDSPLIVQLPEPEYVRLKDEWALPGEPAGA